MSKILYLPVILTTDGTVMASRFVLWFMQLLLLATAATGMSPGAVLAQDSSAPTAEVAAVRTGVAALGRQWNEEVKAQTARLYAGIQRQHPPSGIRELRGASYGTDRRQTLDLYYPDQGFDELGPVIVFLHGDAEAKSDRIADQAANALYANSARSLARFGGVGINANYRQLPHAKWPSGTNDVRAVVQWAHKNVAQYGGDPASIIVLGTGEGAMHLATYLFQQRLTAPGRTGHRGCHPGFGHVRSGWPPTH